MNYFLFGSNQKKKTPYCEHTEEPRTKLMMFCVDASRNPSFHGSRQYFWSQLGVRKMSYKAFGVFVLNNSNKSPQKSFFSVNTISGSAALLNVIIKKKKQPLNVITVNHSAA